MKKLALVLGSLLVVGSVASAKEVVPAPMAAPEVVVKVVEKPVVVYRDRLVQDTKWRPNGYVSIGLKTTGEIESTKSTDDKSWGGADPKTRLELKTNVNLTENQNLEIRTRDYRGLTHRNDEAIEAKEVYVQHTYDFHKVYDKVGLNFQTKYKYAGAGATRQSLRERVNFDFTDYFFSNDYVKTTAAVLAPTLEYSWGHGSAHGEDYGLYADYEATFMPGTMFELGFQAEFDNFYNYSVENIKDGKDIKNHSGAVEFILSKGYGLYKNGKHSVGANIDLDYTTGWLWHKTAEQKEERVKTWSKYEAKLEPTLTYTYAATEYVKLHATLGAEYVNRNTDRKSANHWRWQPYSELGMKVVF